MRDARLVPGELASSPATLKIKTAFKSGGRLPSRYARERLSPPIQWSNVPERAKTLALLLDEISRGGEARSLWIVYNIPATLVAIPEGVSFSQNPLDFPGVVEGRNDDGFVGYQSPRAGDTRRLVLRLLALDQALELPREAGRADVLQAAIGHVVSRGELVATVRPGASAV